MNRVYTSLGAGIIGVTARCPAGWYIFEKRNTLDIPGMFCGLLTVIVIGLVVENLIFRTIERLTVKKWGLQI